MTGLPTVHQLALGLALGLVGLAVNLQPVDAGFGLELMFGGVGGYLLLRLGAAKGAITAAATAGAATYLLWDHPWAWIVFTAEMVACVALVRRGVAPIVADLIYWLLLGIPQVVIYYQLFAGVAELSSYAVAAKQAVNGVAVVALGSVIATILMLTVPAMRISRPQRLRTVIMEILVALAVVPQIVYSASLANQFEQARTNDALRDIERVANATHIQAVRWMEGLVRDAQTWAMLVRSAQQAGDDVATDAVPLPDEIERLDVFGADGRLLARFGTAPLNERLEDADAPFGLADIARAEVRRLATGEGAAADVALIVPVPGPGGARSEIVLAILNPPGVAAALLPAPSDEIAVTILDRSGAVLVSTDPFRVQGGAADDLLALATGPDGVRAGTRGVALVRHDQTMLVASRPILGESWKLVVTHDRESYLFDYRLRTVKFLGMLLAMVMIGIAAAMIVSRVVSRPLERVVQSLGDFDLAGVRQAPLEPVGVQEVDALSAALGQSWTRIAESTAENRRIARRLQSLVEAAPLSLYAVSLRDGVPVPAYASPNFKQLTGFTLDDVARRSAHLARVHPEDRLRIADELDKLQVDGELNSEYRFLRADGTYVWISHVAVLAPDTESGGVEMVGVIRDVTERKCTEAIVMQNAKLILLGEMATGLAHELNQPLNVIRMAAQNAMAIIGDEGTGDAAARDYVRGKLERIDAQIGRSAALIDHMRIFGRADSVESEAFDIGDVVSDALQLVAQELRLAGISLSVSGEAGLHVRGHRQQLEQVLLNVILNARDAITERRMTEGDAAPAWITIRTAPTPTRAGVETIVSDSGGGIDPAVLDRVFEPFVTTKPSGKGTGLGLSLSYGIVTEMGGTITAENGEVGARFRIILPMAAADDPRRDTAMV